MKLGAQLNAAYKKYAARTKHGDYGLDPISIPHRYTDRRDIEVVAFIVSCFSYGSRKAFVPLLDKYIKRLGKHPARTLKNASVMDRYKLVKGFQYRFNTEHDLNTLYYFLGCNLELHSTLRGMFRGWYNSIDKSVIGMLNLVSKSFSETTKLYGDIHFDSLTNKKKYFKSARYLLPSPIDGSPCKRIMMFLRWMCRPNDDGLDFGLWKFIKPSELIIPLDVHSHKTALKLGLTKRHQVNLATAIEITESLKKFDRHDPIKHDFSMYMLGADGAV